MKFVFVCVTFYVLLFHTCVVVAYKFDEHPVLWGVVSLEGERRKYG